MTQQQIDMYVVSNSKKFSKSMLPLVQKKLNSIPDDREILLQTVEYRNPITILILSIFFGTFGVDRFLLKDINMGVAKLLTRLAYSISYTVLYTIGLFEDITDINVLIPTILISLIGLANTVLTIIDWCIIKNKTYLYNYNLLMQFEIK